MDDHLTSSGILWARRRNWRTRRWGGTQQTGSSISTNRKSSEIPAGRVVNGENRRMTCDS